jgi:predicted transcriptional regulator YheO
VSTRAQRASNAAARTGSESDSPPRKAQLNGTKPRASAAERASARRMVAMLEQLVPALAEALGPRTEVVLHDVTKLPNSIVAIANPITGRQAGGPASDLGLEILQSGWSEHLIGYRSELENGTTLRSSSLFLRDEQGRAVCCLCINTDVTSLDKAKDTLQELTELRALSELTGAIVGARGETFPRNIEDLAESVLRDAIADTGIAVGLMKKRHKIAVVAELQRRGFFAIREAVDLAAAALKISRYSVYNYLNEIEAARQAETS